MATVSKLFANGAFQTSVSLDEITRTTVGQSQTGIFASEFDEVTIYPVTNGLAKRETNTGKLMVAGYFDEYSMYAPAGGSPDIVTSGLMVNLANAPSSGATWTDISGNGIDATLQGTPSYVSNNGGGIKLNNPTYSGTDYIVVPYNTTNNTLTVEIVASFNPTQYWATIWGNESYTAGLGFFAFMNSSTSMVYGRPGATATETIAASDSIRHWIFVMNAGQNSLYLNGSQQGTTQARTTGGNATGNFYFGSRHNNAGTDAQDKMNNSNSALQPVYYQMRIYNKALNTTEITQNYNAVKATYGI